MLAVALVIRDAIKVPGTDFILLVSIATQGMWWHMPYAT